ncbi:hypothetical protein Cgig2_022925 [Carnegiea gigantea]|uniref:Uncharacterized protein n=1 Tax=Carnegiea gigantea TaxID=171969 RepID=A0A9Q1K2I0_9CARY|nr:hypothetical protein Cgig2_022925 [Carnegiea gigantea]
MEIKEHVPEHIYFENEHGVLMQQDIVYEWKPIVCGKCKGYGHETDHYKKGTHWEWGPKATTIPAPKQESNKETRGNREEEWVTIPLIMANAQWLTELPNSEVIFHPDDTSNHCHGLLKFLEMKEQGSKPFRQRHHLNRIALYQMEDGSGHGNLKR